MATQLALALGPTSSSSSFLSKLSERSKYRSLHLLSVHRSQSGSETPKEPICSLRSNILKDKKAALSLIGAGLSLTLIGYPAFAAGEASWIQVQLTEPSNALSLPTWAIHISSVAEWITAMTLVWEYGDKSGNETWKGLSWGMIPLLGGALCACTWHFFYNSESLEVLVALQAALTVIGNMTMCLAAFRIYDETSKNS